MPLIAANGTELFYDIAGPEGAPAVIFSNSIGATLEMWDAQARALASHYRVLRYDTRGHGRSPVVDAPATIATFAGDMAGLLDAVGIERAHVVGLSFGGMTAQAFAAVHPARVNGLVLMATSAHLPGDWRARAQAVRTGGMAAVVDAVMARWFTPAFQAMPEAAAVRQHFLGNKPRGYAVCCEVIASMDLRPSNHAITAPTLIIAGAEDPSTPPAMGEDIRGRIPHAELLVLPRAAHLLNIEQAATVNRHLASFLGSLGRPPRPGGAAFEAGLANRKGVLGAAHVDRSLAAAGALPGHGRISSPASPGAKCGATPPFPGRPAPW